MRPGGKLGPANDVLDKYWPLGFHRGTVPQVRVEAMRRSDGQKLRRYVAVALAAALLLPGSLAARQPAPEGSSGWADKAPVVATRHLVVAAHPLAAAAGDEMLDAGGGAVDAAIATQMVLNLVEPQSSGIGGGGFILHWDAGARRLASYDGRETAPAAASPTRFLDARGEPLRFFEAAVGGSSVGVPGLLRMLETAHTEHGKLPWARLFEPAIRLAERGFPMSERLYALLAAEKYLPRYEPARSYFYQADLTPKPVGTLLTNPEFAATLRRLAEAGADAFYAGPMAESIVAAVRGAAARPGDLTAVDLAEYRAVARDPLCHPYRQWRVCGMPPPSSGGLAVLQMLGILETFDLPVLDPLSPEAAHLLAEAGALAFADRDRYIADPDHVRVPVAALLDPAYLRMRADQIHPAAALQHAEPGELPEKHGLADDRSPERPSTSHISIVDSAGNAVAMTTSIENSFGARIMVGGFLLNNQLTDFSFRPEQDDRPVANRVEPNKRPRSSMAPTMAFDAEGRLRLVTGSPGGSRIIGYVARNVVAVLDWQLAPQEAVALPHVLNRNGPTELEAGTAATELRAALESLGHRIQEAEMTSGLHAISIDAEGRLHGGADPRREGVAIGD